MSSLIYRFALGKIQGASWRHCNGRRRPARDENLSQIGTIWSMVYSGPTQGAGEAVTQAQQQLMERYSGAVYRYLMGALHDRHAADDLFQEFALRFVRGAFRNASPERGRFRDFVKTSLYHLIVDHHKRKHRSPQALPVEDIGAEPAVTDSQDFDAEFLHSWRQEILCRTWEALARSSQEGPPFYRVLRLRAEKPDVSSADMAAELSTVLGKPVSADWVRQNLRRAGTLRRPAARRTGRLAGQTDTRSSGTGVARSQFAELLPASAAGLEARCHSASTLIVRTRPRQRAPWKWLRALCWSGSAEPLCRRTCSLAWRGAAHSGCSVGWTIPKNFHSCCNRTRSRRRMGPMRVMVR